jgi:hypothetical protein
MQEDAVGLGQKPAGQGRADEVHLMPSLRQLAPQFAGDHAAAAERMKAEDRDVHG